MDTSNFFPIGATYAPLAKATEVDISEWDHDIETFSKLGLTTFRLFICWDRIEGVRGQRDFSRVDHAFDLASKHGVKVIGNVGGTFANLQAIYPPRWLVYDEHCTLLRPTPDSPQELHFNRFKLCYDNQRYQALAKEFIQAAIARYKDHPALLAWSGWNEPRLSECHCKDTLREYRLWLKTKYGDLNALAKAWSTEFPVSFRTWDDVFPQAAANFEAGGYIPWFDWQRFTSDNRKNKFSLVRNWIKEIDGTTPVISHMCGPHDSDIFGDEDILGTSIYTIHAQRKRADDYPPFDFVSRQNIPYVGMGFRSHRQDPEGFWVVETEAGPVSWVHDMAPRSYSPRKMNARDMLYVAHGARALLRWLYRSRVSDAQAGEFNLVGWDGRVTERASEFGKLAHFLNQHASVFQTHVDDPSGVKILCSDDCHSHCVAEGYQWRYGRSTDNLYCALQHIGIRAQICNVRQLMEDGLAGAKVLFIPFRPHVDVEMAEVLNRFVRAGGLLIAESPFAIKDTNGIHQVKTPGHLMELFGAQVWDLEKLYESDCGGLPAFDFKAKIEVKGGTVERRFADGDPAVVSNRIGKGRAVLYASTVFIGYQIAPNYFEGEAHKVISFEKGQVFRDELRSQLAKAGVLPAFELEDIATEARKHIQVFFRKLPDGRRLLFVLNMDEAANDFALRFPGAERAHVLGCSDEGDPVKTQEGKLRISLKEWGWTVLTID